MLIKQKKKEVLLETLQCQLRTRSQKCKLENGSLFFISLYLSLRGENFWEIFKLMFVPKINHFVIKRTSKYLQSQSRFFLIDKLSIFIFWANPFIKCQYIFFNNKKILIEKKDLKKMYNQIKKIIANFLIQPFYVCTLLLATQKFFYSLPFLSCWCEGIFVLISSSIR